MKSYDWINCGENRIDEYETTTTTTASESIAEYFDETLSDKENLDYEPFAKTVCYDDEPSHYQINRRIYFNMATNKRLNKEFDLKFKNLINIVNEEKAQLCKSVKAKTIVAVENKVVEEPEVDNLNVKRLDNLLISLKEETSYNSKLNVKQNKLLKK